MRHCEELDYVAGMKVLYIAAMSFVLCLVLGSAFAFAKDSFSKDLKVKIDEAHLVRLDGPGAEVIVGNPTIADVAVRNSQLLVVTGKTFGLTNVIVLDGDGKEILNKKISVSANSQRMVTLRKGVLRYSLHCTPVCQSPLVVGDEPDYFDTVNKATMGKFSAANAVLKGAEAAPSR